MDQDAHNANPQWNPGDVVLLRDWVHGRAGFVQTTRVVEDSGEQLVLWWAPGWPCVSTAMADGRSLRETPPAERAALPKKHEVGTWVDAEVLMVAPAGAAHSVWLMWWDGVHGSYYVNLEQPHARHQWPDLRVLDTKDHELDLVISPDLSGWRWKDEDEFAAATGIPGYWTEEEADQIRAEGQHVLDQAQAGKPPFDGRWTTFRPDPTWTPPALPTEWGRPRIQHR